MTSIATAGAGIRPKISPHERPWLTIPDACRWLRKSRPWVEARIKDGRFKTVKDGQRVMIVTDSIREYIMAEAAALVEKVS